MVARGPIVTANSAIVADLSIDPAAIRASGDPLSPALEVPLVVSMPGQEALILGIETLILELWMPGPQQGFGGARLAGPCVVIGIGGQISIVGRASGIEHNIQVSFGLTPERVATLASHAERSLPEPLELEARAAARCVVVREEELLDARSGGPAFLISGYRLTVVPGTGPAVLRFAIPREQWAETLLPGLGAEQVRLVPITFPRTEAGPGNAGRRFDEARRHLDSGRWREAVRACRDVRHVLEQQLAGGGRRVHEAVAERRGLDPSALAFLDSAWEGLAKLTNQASHEKTGQTDALSIGRSEAQAAVRLTAVLVDYAATMP